MLLRKWKYTSLSVIWHTIRVVIVFKDYAICPKIDNIAWKSISDWFYWNPTTGTSVVSHPCPLLLAGHLTEALWWVKLTILMTPLACKLLSLYRSPSSWFLSPSCVLVKVWYVEIMVPLIDSSLPRPYVMWTLKWELHVIQLPWGAGRGWENLEANEWRNHWFFTNRPLQIRILCLYYQD